MLIIFRKLRSCFLLNFLSHLQGVVLFCCGLLKRGKSLALLLSLISLKGGAYYHPHHSNPFCSPGLMAAMLQSEKPFDPRAEKRALEKQIEKLQEEVNDLESALPLQFDKDYGDEVLKQIKTYYLFRSTPSSFGKQMCEEAYDNLQCLSKGGDSFKVCTTLDSAGKCTSSGRKNISETISKKCEVYKMWKNCITRNKKEINRNLCNPDTIHECSMEAEATATCADNDDIHDTTYKVNPLIPDPDAFDSSSSSDDGTYGDASTSSGTSSSCTDLTDLLKKTKELKELEKQLEDFEKLKDEEADYSSEEYLDEYDPAAKVNCMECNGKNAMIDRLERWYKPDKLQRIGQAISSIGGMALGWYGIREANKARARQGFPAQAGHAVQLAYPFIENGIYGGGMFGSSLACSPTAGGGFRGGILHSLFGRRGGGRWGGGWRGGFRGGPGGPGYYGPGGGWNPHFGFDFGMGGGPGGGWRGGPGGYYGPESGYYDGPGGGLWHGGPGGGPWGGGYGPEFGFDFGLGGGPGGGWRGGGRWGGHGGFGGPGGFGGGYAQMQAQMEYQKAMMAYRQNQMNNWMQKQQSVQALQMEQARLQTQIHEIWYGGGRTGGQFTTAGTVGIHANIGGGGSTTKPGGSTVSLGR